MEEDEELTSLVPKAFQVNITVFEAKHLQKANVTVAVVVKVGNIKKVLKAKTKRNDEPYFNRTVKFTFVQPLDDFLKNRVEFKVRRKSYLKFRRDVLGVALMEAATIWYQPKHRYSRKWLTLAKPNDLNAAVTGFLKCSIEIVTESFAPPSVLSSDSEMDVPNQRLFKRQRGLFTVKIFRGDGFQDRKSNYRNMYVKVIFAGITGRTQVAKEKANPVWNEVLHFIECLPTMYQHMDIEIWDKRMHCLVGTTRLSLSDLPYDENKNILPSFGPSFLYIYKKSQVRRYAPKFMGRILVSLSTKALERSDPRPVTMNLPTPPYDESRLPPYAQFTTFITIFQMIMLRKLFKGSQIHITLQKGSSFCSPENASLGKRNYESSINLDLNRAITGKPKPLVDDYSFVDFSEKLLCLQATSLMPAMEGREGKLNYIRNQITKLEYRLKECQMTFLRGSQSSKNCCCKNLLNQIEKIIIDIFDLKLESYATLMEISQWRLFHEYLKEMRGNIRKALNNPLLSIEETVEVISETTEIINRYTDYNFPSFPDIELSVSRDGKLAKYYRALNAADHLLVDTKSFQGQNLGKKQIILFRDTSGSAVVAMEAIIWFGRTEEVYQSLKCLPDDVSGELPHALEGQIIPKVRMKFQLRVYVYQARLNAGSDASGLADPFLRILIPGQVRETQVKYQTLHPFWDETLLFSQVEVLGDRQFIKTQSVGIMFEVLDFDEPNVTELIGRGVLRPRVTFLRDGYMPPRLKWEAIYNYGEETGQVLIAVDLIENEPNEGGNVSKSESQTALFAIPDDIRPHYQPYKLEVIFWGIRDYQFQCISCCIKTMVRLECHGTIVESRMTKAKSITNFPYQILIADILLPLEEEYSPPLCLVLYDFGGCNSTNYRGSCLIDCVERFITKEDLKGCKAKNSRHLSNNKKIINFYTVLAKMAYKLSSCCKRFNEKTSFETNAEVDETIDWWTKYYSSKHNKSTSRTIKIYKEELENQQEFGGFQDFLQIASLTSGKSDLRKSKRKECNVAILKCAVKLHPQHDERHLQDGEFTAYPRNCPIDITVRVYIIAGRNLTPTNPNGHCNPYLSLTLGKEKMSSRKSYISRDTNPIFGKLFEFKSRLPWDYKLSVRVMDYDSVCCDSLIGGTSIDIENRFYTCHRAACGLSDTYETSGYCQWRDLLYPSDILRELCKLKQIPPPAFNESYAVVGSSIITRQLEETEEELALRILKNSSEISDLGFMLVPEHIETRPLIHPDKGNIDQGKLEMWVDIFPGHEGLPEPVYVAPRQPQSMELRVIVWKTTNVPVSEGFFSATSNLYIKAWLTSKDEAQLTDVHYKALAGEGLFNWRFIFKFEYSPTIRKVIINKKSTFSSDSWVEKIPCVLNLQVWDDDIVFQEHLGSLNLTLWDLPKGAKYARSSTLSSFDNTSQRVNLFKVKSIRGWWPFRMTNPRKKEEYKIAGKVDLELQLLTKAEALGNPVGLGRSLPQPLPVPKRLNLAVFWFLSPFTIVCRSICGSYRKEIFGSVIVIGIILFILMGVYSIPGYLVKKAMNA